MRLLLCISKSLILNDQNQLNHYERQNKRERKKTLLIHTYEPHYQRRKTLFQDVSIN